MEENNNGKSNMFYNLTNGTIPIKVINDFVDNSNFLLIFVNPRSGSQEGKIILEHISKYKEVSIRDYNIIHFPIDDQNDYFPTHFYLSRSNSLQSLEEIKIKGGEHPTKFDPSIPFSTIIFNIIEEKEYKNGKNFIKNYLNDFPDEEIKILIGGGDGSVLSIIEDLHTDKIDIERCIFGAMPLGTGNDLSNAMGFGPKCEIGLIEYFQRVLYTYLTAYTIKTDIWKLQLKVDKNEGKIFDIVSSGEIELKDENNNDLKYFTKTFINYMSIGFDAKVGFMFEQRRTGSRLFNKAIYALESGKNILRALFRKKFGLPSLLENLISLEGEDIKNKILSNDENYFLDEEYLKTLKNKKIIFETIDKGQKNNYNRTILKGNPVVIVCQNIDYYMGGAENIWGSSKQIGIQACGLRRKEKKLYQKKITDSFHKQSSNDKQIEFITYTHGMDMGIDRYTGGKAKRIYQGSGPFYYTFKKILSKGQKKKLNNVYINIDGEFYHLVQPKQILISLNDQICNGQIKFLKNEIAIWRLKQKTMIQKIRKNIKYYKYFIITITSLLLFWKFNFDSTILFLIYMFLLFF